MSQLLSLQTWARCTSDLIWSSCAAAVITDVGMHGVRVGSMHAQKIRLSDGPLSFVFTLLYLIQVTKICPAAPSGGGGLLQHSAGRKLYQNFQVPSFLNDLYSCAHLFWYSERRSYGLESFGKAFLLQDDRTEFISHIRPEGLFFESCMDFCLFPVLLWNDSPCVSCFFLAPLFVLVPTCPALMCFTCVQSPLPHMRIKVCFSLCHCWGFLRPATKHTYGYQGNLR